MSADRRCARCDRAECNRGNALSKFMSQPLLLSGDMVEQANRLRRERDVAAEECAAHERDWRAEALASRALLREVWLPATDATDSPPRATHPRAPCGAAMSATFAIAQLRHLYAQMLAGEVRDTAEAARGLLGPAIAELERYVDRSAKAEALLREAAAVVDDCANMSEARLLKRIREHLDGKP